VSLFGRDELIWDEMAEAGEAFLVERARLARLTSYTELNATLVRRTGLPGFDFSRQDERAAMGHLLGLIVERNRPVTGLMISALVTYLDANDAGPGSTLSPSNLATCPAAPPPAPGSTSGSARSRPSTTTTLPRNRNDARTGYDIKGFASCHLSRPTGNVRSRRHESADVIWAERRNG
jgi:hypothetical protein